jgi:hypothetical protein
MKKTLIVLALLVLAGTAVAQGSYTGVSYNVTGGIGRAGDYIGSASWLGFTVDGRRFIDKNVAVGFSLGWQVLDERTTDAIYLDNGAIQGTQIRILNAFPLLANIGYFLGERHDLRPYLALNAGTSYIAQQLNIGVLTINNDNWHFTLAPELGAYIPVDGNTSLYVNGRYYYNFDSGTTMKGDDSNDYGFWSVQVGFSSSL